MLIATPDKSQIATNKRYEKTKNYVETNASVCFILLLLSRTSFLNYMNKKRKGNFN